MQYELVPNAPFPQMKPNQPTLPTQPQMSPTPPISVQMPASRQMNNKVIARAGGRKTSLKDIRAEKIVLSNVINKTYDNGKGKYNVYRISNKYDVDGSIVEDDLFFDGPDIYCDYIKSDPNEVDKKPAAHFIFDRGTEDGRQNISGFENLYNSICEKFKIYGSQFGLGSDIKPQSYGTLLKSILYYPRDKNTQQLLTDRNPSIYVKLKPGWQGKFTRFIEITADGKPKDHPPQEMMKLKFWGKPCYHVRQIYSGNIRSINMELESVILTGVESNNSSQMDDEIIHEMVENGVKTDLRGDDDLFKISQSINNLSLPPQYPMMGHSQQVEGQNYPPKTQFYNGNPTMGSINPPQYPMMGQPQQPQQVEGQNYPPKTQFYNGNPTNPQQSFQVPNSHEILNQMPQVQSSAPQFPPQQFSTQGQFPGK